MIRSVFMLQLLKSFHLVPQNTALVHGKNAFPCFLGNGTIATWNQCYRELRLCGSQSKSRSPSPPMYLSSARLPGYGASARGTRERGATPARQSQTTTLTQHLLSSPQQLNFLMPENQTESTVSPSFCVFILTVKRKHPKKHNSGTKLMRSDSRIKVKKKKIRTDY